MKTRRLAAFAMVLLISACALFAGFDYRLDIVSLKPLHREYLADKDSGTLQFNYMDIYRGFPDHVFQDGKSWDGWEWDPVRFDFHPDSRMMTEGTFAAQIKLGESLSLLRHTFSFDHWLSPVSFDLTFSGCLDIMMEGAVADMVAYDGAYFYGMTLSVGDVFSMRTGFHHLCTHYGDAVMKAVPSAGTTKPDRGIAPAPGPSEHPRDEFNVTYKYVRMNGVVIGLSIEPVEYVRLYGEYNFVPKNVKSLRPVMFQPSWVDISKNEKYPKEYRNQIINFGIELSYPLFPKLGKTRLGYDCHMYEEGKIKYRNPDGSYIGKEDSYSYDPSAPWMIDHGLVLSQQFNDSLSVELGWHTGRSPLHAFWYMEDPAWFYIGARFDPSPTVTVYDTAGH